MITRPKTHALRCTLDQIRAFFEDDHVHMALIVATDGTLVTTIDRADLTVVPAGPAFAATFGTLDGRIVGPSDSLDRVAVLLLRARRRRLAVVDDSGRLVGLLCAKQDGTGYCSDAGISRRAAANPGETPRVVPTGHS